MGQSASPLTAELSAVESKTGASDDSPRTFTVEQEPISYGESGASYGTRRDDRTGTLYVFKRTVKSGEVKDRNVASAVEVARIAAVGLL